MNKASYLKQKYLEQIVMIKNIKSPEPIDYSHQLVLEWKYKIAATISSIFLFNSIVFKFVLYEEWEGANVVIASK